MNYHNYGKSHSGSLGTTVRKKKKYDGDVNMGVTWI
jgi:hypothetical protein